MTRREFGIALGAYGLGMATAALLLLMNKKAKDIPTPKNLRLKSNPDGDTVLLLHSEGIHGYTHCPKCGHFWLRDYPGYPNPPTHCPACSYVAPGHSHVTLKIKAIPDERLPRALPPTWTLKEL